MESEEISIWEDITYQCYREYERLIDLLAIKLDENRGKNGK